MPNTFFKININILHKIKVINLQFMLNFCDVFFFFMLVDTPPPQIYRTEDWN